MAKKIKKTCCVCGKTYEIYCPTCREAINQPSWMNIFHDESCKKIYETSSAYLMGMMDAESAKRIFDTCDLTDKDKFKVKFQKVIDEVYEATKVEEVVEEKLETITTGYIAFVDDIEVDGIAEATVATAISVEDATVVKPNNYKKRKKKKKNKMIDSDLEK